MRRHSFSLGSVLLLAGWFLLLSNDRACAYIDPGTGSWLLQCIVGAVLAGAFFIKAFWAKIKARAARLLGRKGAQNDG